ncbi:hypothetical protein IW262DRAFT_1301498 [Armillaria fumosa]|nr:hypothetical protein IW262DRAFT_1301498 [Armillaria fumosa]
MTGIEDFNDLLPGLANAIAYYHSSLHVPDIDAPVAKQPRELTDNSPITWNKSKETTLILAERLTAMKGKSKDPAKGTGLLPPPKRLLNMWSSSVIIILRQIANSPIVPPKARGGKHSSLEESNYWEVKASEAECNILNHKEEACLTSEHTKEQAHRVNIEVNHLLDHQ